jgi:Na+/Pi-cotransporter
MPSSAPDRVRSLSERTARPLVRVGGPLFFNPSSSLDQDKAKRGAAFFLAMLLLFLSMAGLMYSTQFLLFGMSTKIVHTVTSSCNGYLAMLIGCGITIFVQSSSLITSMLVPVAGIGAMQMQTVFPVVLGANVGTALQAMMTALGAIGKAPLQIALSHVVLNVIGVLMWYPIPHLRRVPIYAAKRLGRGAEIWRLFPILWLALMWCVMEIYFIGLSSLFTNGTESGLAVGIVLVVVTSTMLAGIFYWCKFRGGDSKYVAFMDRFTAERLQDKFKHGVTLALAGRTTPVESDVVPPSPTGKTLKTDTSSSDQTLAKETQPVAGSDRNASKVVAVNASVASEQPQTASGMTLRQHLAMSLDEEHGLGVRLAISDGCRSTRRTAKER